MMKARVYSIALLVAVLALAFVLPWRGSVPGSAAEPVTGASEATERTISVSGEGRVSAKPDMARISLGASITAATAAEAMQQVSQTVNAVLDQLAALNIPKEQIQSQGVSLYEVVRWDYSRDDGGKGQEVREFRSEHYLTIETTDLDGVGQLVDAAVVAGANRIQSISFGVKDSLALEEEALRRAMKAARTKADALAGAAGTEVTSVITVQAGGVYGIPVQSAARGLALEAAAPAMATTTIEAGQLLVTAQVQAVFAHR